MSTVILDVEGVDHMCTVDPKVEIEEGRFVSP